MEQDIIIDDSKTKLSCRITSRSMHVTGIQIQVIDRDGNTIIEEYPGSTDNTVTIGLINPPGFYKGKFISGTFVIASTNGDDQNDYELEFILLEDNEEMGPAIILTGKTEGGLATRIATFNTI